MTTTSTGRQAEDSVAEYLKNKGYKILEQNWRTRWCEIDIIAQKNNTVYFVEVKYRRTNTQGDGLNYITPQKLRQMGFAAEMWVSSQNWSGEYEMAAAAVSGEDFEVTDIIEI